MFGEDKRECSTCKYAEVFNSGNILCRRFPPQVVVRINSTFSHGDGRIQTVQESKFPSVMASMWCGEWEIH